MWQRKVRWFPYNYQVLSSSYVIQMTGGSITIMDRPSMSVLERHTGHKALYTGDIHPDDYLLTDRLPLDDPEAFCWKQFQLDLEKRREVIL